MCNQDISAQGVWNIVQTLGEKIKELENRVIELNDKWVPFFDCRIGIVSKLKTGA